jgi:hypothetical protein
VSVPLLGLGSSSHLGLLYYPRMTPP